MQSQGLHGRARCRHAPVVMGEHRRRERLPDPPLRLWSILMRTVDLSIAGRSFGDLLALRPDGVCGEYSRVRRYDLLRGATTSCGCKRVLSSRALMDKMNERRNRKRMVPDAA
jgi:hypothetical protein